MSWSIESPYSPQWFKNVQICYRWYADGDGGQCGGGAARLLCASVGKLRRSTGTTPIIAAVGVECLGSSNYHLCIVRGRGISSCATNGIQMVMVDSVVVVLLASFVLWPTSGLLTTEMIPTTEEVDAA
ncbi:Hypothetical predicted protein [Paramuricea clavata]|uniref:Uncharacterized protein n=2 Tax=Paramuricea clavata TaxID=317549 RepID=A0A6S7KXH4_PARCT|nr:Hypothetical predicted protein [Paramuricea clavata]